MNEQDFNRIKEIAKELNDIRIKNNLTELQLRAKDEGFTHYDFHKEWNEIMLLTRGEHWLRDCKIVKMKQDKETNKIDEDMEYGDYINYK
jgi:hypothetical protein